MDEQTLIAHWEAEAQEPFEGWDFSHLDARYHEDAPPWSYDDHVRAALTGAQSLLDMGTGGGEKLLEFRAVLPRLTVATEGYPPNLPVARRSLEPHGIQVVPYDAEAEARLPFASSAFDVIINRHEAYDAAEVARVLRPGGRFCTQQVDGRDLDDLYAYFGQRDNPYQHVQAAHFERALTAAGLRVTTALDWSGRAHFSDVGALVYFLHAVPWEAPADFSVQTYREALLRLHRLPRLEFTIRRFYLEAVKPA